MPIISCTCGFTFSGSSIPDQYLYHLISDVAIEGLVDNISQTFKTNVDVEARIGFLILNSGADVYRCQNCNRLLVFEKGQNKAQVYKLETEEQNSVNSTKEV